MSKRNRLLAGKGKLWEKSLMASALASSFYDHDFYLGREWKLSEKMRTKTNSSAMGFKKPLTNTV